MIDHIKRIGFAVVGFTVVSCGNNQVQQAPPPVAVALFPVKAGNASYYELYPATVTPLNQIDIKPQVSGNIINIFFQDGQHVTKGQKLYEIDQQQYMGAYQQAVANLNVAKANLAKSQQDADRYQDLAKEDAIAKQTLDHQVADLESSKRQVEAAEANVATVQTNLKYSVIYAPFNGTIGLSQVKIGTSVYPQSLLNTISTDEPMAVDIAIDQTDIPYFARYLGTRTTHDSTFTVLLPDGSPYPYPGYLLLIDRAVDPQTGTIKARLVFQNPKKLLTAGITTNVRVRHDGGQNSLLIPYKSVVEQLGEYFVFVVNNGKAFQHKVVLGTRVNDKIVVKSGVQDGDSVVTEGVQKLRDSVAVRSAPPKAPSSK